MRLRVMRKLARCLICFHESWLATIHLVLWRSFGLIILNYYLLTMLKIHTDYINSIHPHISLCVDALKFDPWRTDPQKNLYFFWYWFYYPYP